MAASDATLADKLAVLERVTKAAGWREIDRACAEVKFTRGHEEHGDNIATVRCVEEASDEALDLAGYAAIEVCKRIITGLPPELSWRWRLAVRLAGVILRLLDGEDKAVRKQQLRARLREPAVWHVSRGLAQAPAEPEEATPDV